MVESSRPPRPAPRPRPRVSLYPSTPTRPLPTLEQTVKQALDQHNGAIVLTQVGSFYESYFDQAKQVSRLLSLKLTSKSFNKQRVSSCGFLISQLDKHLTTLIDQGYRVVILNEFKQPVTLQIERRVVRIVSPGTALDYYSKANDGDQANYLVGLSLVDQSVGLVFKDLSTGLSYSKQTSIAGLRDELLLIEPSEVVYDPTRISHDSPLYSILIEEQQRQQFTLSPLGRTLDYTTVQDQDLIGQAELVFGDYVDHNLGQAKPSILATESHDDQLVMKLDSMTIKSLELRESARGTKSGSLTHHINKTLTKAGTRLLSQRLCSPSTDFDEIESRLDVVEGLVLMKFSADYLVSVMGEWADLSKLVQRLSTASINQSTATQLLSIKHLLNQAHQAKELITDEVESIPSQSIQTSVSSLVDQILVPFDLVDAIELAIDEETLTAHHQDQERQQEIIAQLGQSGLDKTPGLSLPTSSTKWATPPTSLIRKQFNQSLEACHHKLAQLISSAHKLENELRDRLSSPNLSLRDVIKHGPVLHVLRKDGTTKLDSNPNLIKVQTKVDSASTRTYHYQPWNTLHQQIEDQVATIRAAEREALKSLVDMVKDEYHSLQTTADQIAKLDVSLSFARLAIELKLVRPKMSTGRELFIVEGRHLGVERAANQAGRPYTTNSVSMDYPRGFIHLLTGPNMAGKSSFLRQNALIVILGQAGSFVPAKSCTIGLVDRVFSRVGARDELDRNKSSFMVEAEEAACILNESTDRSLVLLDELGRGTSPVDGISVAYATLEHILNVNKARTLFATHYHNLGQLIPHEDAAGVGEWRGLEFWCTSVRQEQDSVVYSRKVRPGLNDDSSGLIIARLAGIPDRAVVLATTIKNKLATQL